MRTILLSTLSRTITLWAHLAALSAIAVAQQLLAAGAANPAHYVALYAASAVLLFTSFLAFARTGFDAVEKTHSGTVPAVLLGALFGVLSQTAGLLAGAALFPNALSLPAAVYSISAAALAGGVFCGFGAVVARVHSRHWLKH